VSARRRGRTKRPQDLGKLAAQAGKPRSHVDVDYPECDCRQMHACPHRRPPLDLAVSTCRWAWLDAYDDEMRLRQAEGARSRLPE
jgi:hypothetical protein